MDWYTAIYPGMKVKAEALDGKYYMASVLEVSHQWTSWARVWFDGYGALWVPFARLMIKKEKNEASGVSANSLARLEPGVGLQVEEGGVWYKATVLQVSASKKRKKAPVKVHFDGHDVKYDGWYPADKLRSKLLKNTATQPKAAPMRALAGPSGWKPAGGGEARDGLLGSAFPLGPGTKHSEHTS